MVEIDRCMTVSTEHFPVSELDRLVPDLPLVLATNFGAWWTVFAYVPMEALDEFPDLAEFPAFRAVIEYARRHECRYLRLDPDAHPTRDLPQYEHA